MKRRLLLLAALPLQARAGVGADAGPDATWTALLRKHLRLQDGGRASRLHYAGMAVDRGALQVYLATLSAVGAATFAAWSGPQQMAFLINAYNAFTVDLVLTRHPALQSIKDLGSLLQSPWQRRFVPLLGETLSLDDIEHERLRQRGRYDDPRVHFALNCASLGCPMLREEAYSAERLDAQLDDQVRRFLGDHRRNRHLPASGQLALSKIFDWYGDDFRRGHRGIASVAAFCAPHAELLADAPAERERVRREQAPLTWLDDDWQLNDAPR